MRPRGQRQGFALYLAVVSIVAGSVLVLSALQLANSGTGAARRWSDAAQLAALLHTTDLSGSATDTMAIGGEVLTIDSGATGWTRDRVRLLDDSLFSRWFELGVAGQRGIGSRRSGRLVTWCIGSDSLAVPRPLCPLAAGRFGTP